ncbi:Transcriptional regulator, TetR family protein [Minicystis rosea]|nr:Transcriptional regulator, TetR family protein [Minicystis rosea]
MNAKTEQKQRTHEAILESAARLLRERGLRAPSVADVMGGAGLTVGGFYAHFQSKDALFDEVLRRTYRAMWERMLGQVKGETANERALSVLRRYLSRSHRDGAEEGCPLPATVGEVSAAGEPFRGTLAAELDAYADAYASLLPGPNARRTALGLIALMYGGLSLARAVQGTPLSDAILAACRELGAAALSTPEQKPAA